MRTMNCCMRSHSMAACMVRMCCCPSSEMNIMKKMTTENRQRIINDITRYRRYEKDTVYHRSAFLAGS